MLTQTLTATAMAHGAPAAHAGLSLAMVFANAAPLQKLIMLGLVLATAVGVAIAARKLAAGPHLLGGSAFVSGLRFGAPIAGALGGAFAMLRMALGVANVDDVSLKVLAPGLAEAAAVVTLGFFCGVVAVVFNWAIESKIDREVLG